MALKIKSVDFHVTENARNHFTDRFEMVHMEPAIPVIRRGQKFSFTIAFEDRDYNKDVDEIKFIFSTGGSSQCILLLDFFSNYFAVHVRYIFYESLSDS